jgi:predicted DNA-binding transcriptional regulator AlpA
MAGRQTGSAELRDALDRFYALSTRDQLEFFGRAREHLGSGAWAEDEVEKEIEKRDEALEALEVVVEDLRARGEFREGKSPTTKEFDTVAERLGLEIRSGFVVRAFLRWREARKVLEGGRGREKPSRRRARSAAVGRSRTHEDHLTAVRRWLQTDPGKVTMADYDAFVDEQNRKADGVERRLPGADAVTTGLRIGWPEVLQVARGELELDDARSAKESELLEGLTDESLVRADVVVALTGIRSQRIGQLIRKGEFPVPAAKLGHINAWFLGDVKRVRDEVSVPRRAEFFFQDEVFDLPQIAIAIDRNVDSVRTLLTEEDWDRIPHPDGKASGTWYWLRSNVDLRKWKTRQRGR